ncbi:MAG: hypothetical protein IJN11_02780 [Oscillospiraceae bacterium]|nr:hypothetical protein [Oscillospiraceae bacterium]
MKKILACLACALTMCMAPAVSVSAAQDMEPAVIVCAAEDEILTADVSVAAVTANGVSIVAEAAGEESSADEGGFDVMNLVIGVIAGVIITAIIMAILAGQLKSVKSEEQAKEYVVRGSFKLTGKRDIFLYKRLEKKEKPQNND